jgi:hypothetical protein
MRLTTAVLIVAGCVFTWTSAGAATTDEVKWINQCVSDNNGGASAAVVLKYCTCMNNKMNDNETPVDHTVGEEPPDRAQGLRPGGGLEVAFGVRRRSLPRR